MSGTLAIILPAGGASSRFGANKLLADLAGRSVLRRTAEAFLDRADVALLVIATGQTPVDFEHPKLLVCAGGANRAETVRRALNEVPEGVEWVAIHDAARPLVSQALIDRVLEAARTHGAAGPGLPVALTIKRVDTIASDVTILHSHDRANVGSSAGAAAQVRATVPRHGLWAMQTPQVIRRADLLEAFARCPIPLDQVTDDLQLIELIGKPSWLVMGEERNLKITTPLDLTLARRLLDEPPAGV